MRWNDSLELFISSNISNILKPLNCHCLTRRVRSPGRQWSGVPGCSCWRSGSCWSGWPGSCPGGSGPGGYRGRTDGNVRLHCPSLYSREWAVLPPRHELQGNCLSSLLLSSRSVSSQWSVVSLHLLIFQDGTISHGHHILRILEDFYIILHFTSYLLICSCN